MRTGADRWWLPTAPPAAHDAGPAAPPLVRSIAEAVVRSGLDRFDCIIETSTGPIRVAVRVHASGTEVESSTIELPWSLTMREVDVLSLLTTGLSNAQIAARLGVAPRTVATHIERALPKLGCETRTAAAVLATHHGLLVLPVPGGTGGLPPVPLARVGDGLGVPAPTDRSRSAPPGARCAPAPIVIGALYPRSAATDADALDMRRGAELAIARINERGGIGGRPIRLVVERAGSAADDIESALDRLLAADVDALTFGYTLVRERALFERLFDRIAEARPPLLHTFTSHVATDVVRAERGRFGGILQVSPAESRYGAVFADAVGSLPGRPGRDGPRVLAVIEAAEPSLKMWTERADSDVERAGWRIERRAFPTASAGWAADALDWLERVGPVAGVFAGLVLEDQLRAFLDAHARRPTGALVYAPYAPSVPGFAERAGGTADGLVWSTTIGTGDDVPAAGFRAAFARQHGRSPGRSSAASHFDMVNLLADAWRRVDSPRDFGGVAGAVAGARVRGVNGVYAFDPATLTAQALAVETNDPTLGKRHPVFRIRDGHHVPLVPSGS